MARPIHVPGLSPRVRGNLGVVQRRTRGRRSIPAGAGEPRGGGARIPCFRVYPRGCGGTALFRLPATRVVGLSPRVRGNPDRHGGVDAGRGSIPAGAGEPIRAAIQRPKLSVYPRGCGGTATDPMFDRFIGGLSPRVRGNRAPPPFGRGIHGSIPAGAGEPLPDKADLAGHEVYPRGCGGTSSRTLFRVAPYGLSPRVRGNPPGCELHEARWGSIPAGAGEPGAAGRSRRSRSVYPRGCGGTKVVSSPTHVDIGLSPRVRGNRPGGRRRCAGRWSIPAGAGEPSSAPTLRSRGRVYPRGCGGTHVGLRGGADVEGLSPRVRGNPGQLEHRGRRSRSIPAGAGEPWPARAPRPTVPVYPRGCGGTWRPQAPSAAVGGLSPRVRGNRRRLRLGFGFGRSIPAGAGEPG